MSAVVSDQWKLNRAYSLDTRRMLRFLCCIIISFIIAFSEARADGGGDLNPNLETSEQALEEWRDRRVGLSIHWGPSSLRGQEIGWSRGEQIEVSEYDNLYKEFEPRCFDANEWAALFARWGIRYVSPTAKHHDGFSLFYSDFSKYDMENAGYAVDVMGELVGPLRQRDISLGAYYSIIDWYHPDWSPYEQGGPGSLFARENDAPNSDRYFAYLEAQVLELIEKYDVEFIQFDGDWSPTLTHERGAALYRRFHQANPDILVNSRIDVGRQNTVLEPHDPARFNGSIFAGDFHERERTTTNFVNEDTAEAIAAQADEMKMLGDYPWQAWVSIDKSQWGYSQTPDLMSFDELVRDLLGVVGRNGNYMINVAPDPSGRFSADRIELMDRLGAWLERYGRAIYGTRGGPFAPFAQGVSTMSGDRVWLFITDTDFDGVLSLPHPALKIVSANVFDSEKAIPFQQVQDRLSLDLRNYPSQSEIRVIELVLHEQGGSNPSE